MKRCQNRQQQQQQQQQPPPSPNCPLCDGRSHFVYTPKYSPECLPAATKLNLLSQQTHECPFCSSSREDRFMGDENDVPPEDPTPPPEKRPRLGGSAALVTPSSSPSPSPFPLVSAASAPPQSSEYSLEKDKSKDDFSDDLEILHVVLPRKERPAVKQEFDSEPEQPPESGSIFSKFSPEEIGRVSPYRVAELVLRDGCEPVAVVEALLGGATNNSDARDEARRISAERIESQATALMQVESEEAARQAKSQRRAQTLCKITEGDLEGFWQKHEYLMARLTKDGDLFREYLVPSVPPMEVEASSGAGEHDCICGQQHVNEQIGNCIARFERELATAAPKRRREFYELLELLESAVRWYGIEAQKYCEDVEEELCQRVQKLQIASDEQQKPPPQPARQQPPPVSPFSDEEEMPPEDAVAEFERKEIARLRMQALSGILLQRFIAKESGRLQLAMFLPKLRESLALPVLFRPANPRAAVTQEPEDVTEALEEDAEKGEKNGCRKKRSALLMGETLRQSSGSTSHSKRLRREWRSEMEELNNPSEEVLPLPKLPEAECCQSYARRNVGRELLSDRDLLVGGLCKKV